MPTERASRAEVSGGVAGCMVDVLIRRRLDDATLAAQRCERAGRIGIARAENSHRRRVVPGAVRSSPLVGWIRSGAYRPRPDHAI